MRFAAERSERGKARVSGCLPRFTDSEHQQFRTSLVKFTYRTAV